MRDSLAESVGSSTPGSSSSPSPDGLRPTLDVWLRSRTPAVAAHWHAEVVRRGAVRDEDLVELLERFLRFVSALVPACLGGDRRPMTELLREAGTLYGALGAVRGLAAGEVVDELQILREAILREVFGDSPTLDGGAVKLRDAIQLNRAVDMAVTQASVSHTDQLFYQLLKGNGVPSTPTPELLSEIRAQLSQLEQEAGAL